MKTILFQGDSITDFGRSRDNDMYLGHGYPTMVAGMLAAEYPGEIKFYNRGISGNRIVDLYARIKCDAINLNPDYISILIGVNDVWHEIGWKNGVSPEKYKKIYDMYVSEIKQALPNVKIIILEPFVLSGNATQEHLDEFEKGVYQNAKYAKEIAEKHDCIFVPLQEKLTNLGKNITNESVLYDGVHPYTDGAALIASELCKVYRKLL